jgi:Ca-activated chloride channel family protein
VTFRDPAFLLLLLLVPAAAALYLREQRTRRGAAAAFSTRALLPSVAPTRPRWRRHAPMVVYAAALAALAVALARPEATVAVAEERASVVLALDTSGSMQARDVAPTRLQAVREAAGGFVDDAPDSLRVGAVAFNHRVRRIETPETDHAEVRTLVERLRPRGGTATGEALAASLRLLEAERRDKARRPPAAVVLLSDGAATHGREPLPVAREAARLGVPVHTVALGTDGGTIEVRVPGGGTRTETVPPDRETLERIAALSGGRAFEVEEAGELASVYDELGSRVATKEERREVTAAFAGAAALLLAGGGLLSLRWFGRLP